MSEHKYPFSAIRGDHIRAAAGLLLCGVPLFLVPVSPVPTVLLGCGTAVFGYFGWRNWVRQQTVMTLGDDGLTAAAPRWRGRHARILWSDIGRVRLRFFSTRRDRSEGWLELAVRGGGTSLNLDSNISGFADIARRVFAAAAENGVEMPAATLANFRVLGLDTAPEEDTGTTGDAGQPPPERGWGRPKDWISDSQQ